MRRDVVLRRHWGCFLDYVQPIELINDAVKAASRKASLPVRDLLIRSFLARGLLAYATSLVFIVLSQNIAPIVGAILFPVGFVILALLGLELATGNFALLPVGWATGEVSFSAMIRNLGWVYLGNLAGSLFYGLLFYLAVTNSGASGSGAADHEPGGEHLSHRDRPIRWVQRKPSSPISAPSEVL